MARSKETAVVRAAGQTQRRRRIARWLEQVKQPEESVQFHPVHLVSTPEPEGRNAQRRSPIEIVLADGRRVVVPEGFAAEELRRVLNVLEGSATC